MDTSSEILLESLTIDHSFLQCTTTTVLLVGLPAPGDRLHQLPHHRLHRAHPLHRHAQQPKEVGPPLYTYSPSRAPEYGNFEKSINLQARQNQKNFLPKILPRYNDHLRLILDNQCSCLPPNYA